MTKKKIHSLSSDSKIQALEEYISFYLDQVSDLNVSSIHFFDEASVTKTTMTRRYGNATIGTPANFTVNLMHSCLGVDYVSVIEGASNGNELLLFFKEAVGITRRDGSVIFEGGDTVIMDNCRFHHGRSCRMFHIRFGKGTENTVLCVTKALKITCYLNVKDQHKICIFVLSICQSTVECGRQSFIGQTVFRDSSRANHLRSTHSMNLELVGSKVGGFPLVTFNF